MTTRPSTPRASRPLRTLEFVDRVMAQVAEEPQPTAARVFLRSVAGLRLHDAAAALATAGHLAFGRSVAVPAFVRAQSLVLLLVFIVIVGSGGTLAAAGAIRVIGDRSVPPRVEQPLLVPQISSSPAPEATPSPDVRPTIRPAGDSVEQLDVGRDQPTPAVRRGDGSRQDGQTQERDREGGAEPRQSGGKSGQSDRDTSGDRSGTTASDRPKEGGGRPTRGTPEPAAVGDHAPVGRHQSPSPDREQDAGGG